MPRCEECQKDFATQEGLDQHNADKHGASINRHEVRQQKRQQKLAEQAQERGRAKTGKRTKQIAIMLGVSFVLAAVIYAVVFIFPNQGVALPNGGSGEGAGTMDAALLNFNLRAHTGSLTLHIHPHLEIEINGEKQVVPANVGIGPAGMRVIHTHEADGVLHIESPSPHQFNVGDFFIIWGETFNSTCVLDYCVDETHELKLFLNDEEVSTFEHTPMRDLDRVRIVYDEKAAA